MDQGAPNTPAVEHLRELAAGRVNSTSLRSVAREIGMSPTGLKKFINGTSPYGPTLRKLRKWHVRYVPLSGDEVGEQHAEAALHVLTQDLLPAAQEKTIDCVLECVAGGYDASGRSRPRWVSELRAHYGARKAS
jgi:hypothetical protein